MKAIGQIVVFVACWLVWLVVRAYVFVARKPSFVFKAPDSGAPYLKRWPIWTVGPWPDEQGRTGGEGWYLHQFLASDHERALHNHPAAYGVAFPVRGGYFETRVQRDEARDVECERWFGPGSMNVITSETFHRVTLPRGSVREEIHSWSLFYIGPRSGRGWGFLQPDGTVRRADHHDGHTGAVVERAT